MVDIEFVKIEHQRLAGNETLAVLLIPELLLQRGARFLAQTV
ncbi:hypothetical protein [Rhizobium ruizarguesonis]|nr:hypothetical protein [Rhizobium ruizarguesonis]